MRWRFDLSFPQYRLIIEYDGMQHRDPDQWAIDIDRRGWMDAHDWRIVVVIAKGIYRTPAMTLARIIDGMRDRGMTVPRLSTSGASTSRAFPVTSPDQGRLASVGSTDLATPYRPGWIR